MKRIADELKNIMGNDVRPTILNALKNDGSIVIQCKDYDHGGKPGYEELIYFQPTGAANSHTITIESIWRFLIKNPGKLERFEDWLSLVEFSYTKDKATLGLS